jgi:holo-[acyl-carrier protein] synthase
MIGLGLDVVELDRFRRTLERTPSFGRRVFTAAETAYSEARNDPTERFAARFAAKEAVLKAMGLGLWSCPLTDIEVVRAGSGAPSVALHGRGRELAVERGIDVWHLTMTHTDRIAVALAVALDATTPLSRDDVERIGGMAEQLAASRR